MKQIGFSQEEIKQKKEKVTKQKAILDLYQSIESGYSQCHHTGNRVKASGGWDLQVCQHGVTQASKFLFIESAPLGRFDLVVAMSVCMYVCMYVCVFVPFAHICTYVYVCPHFPKSDVQNF